MTQNRDRKNKIRARMAAAGEPYSEAARQIDRAAGQARLTPPPGWRSALPEMMATWREGDHRVVEVLDAASGQRLASAAVPWRDPDELVAEYEAAGMMDGVPGSAARDEMMVKVRLGRPDLIVNRLGWKGGLAWQEWPDGTWRSPAFRLGRRHLVTAAPLSPVHATIGTITIREYPGGNVVADEIIEPVRPDDTAALDRALDRLGYTVDLWTALPGHVRYGAALPGHLAERDWYTVARICIVKETTVGAVDPRVPRTFRAGEIVTMNQDGRVGREVLRDTWWDSSDIDGAHIIRADCAEIVEVLEDHPPTFAAAALPRARVLAVLGPGAEGWDSQGILVIPGIYDLEIRASSGELLGLVKRGGQGAGYDNIHADQPVTYRAVIREDASYHPPAVSLPAGFIPPDPARCTAGERARWGGTGTGTAAGVQVSTARVIYGPDVPCDSCTCCTMDGCHRGEGSECHWSEALGDYTCPCTCS